MCTRWCTSGSTNAWATRRWEIILRLSVDFMTTTIAAAAATALLFIILLIYLVCGLFDSFFMFEITNDTIYSFYCVLKKCCQPVANVISRTDMCRQCISGRSCKWL
jgi:hypothetical protein